MEDALLRIAAVVVAVGAAGGVMAKAIKDIWKMAQRVKAILDLVEYELQPNEGGSLRDQVDANYRALSKLRKNQADDENIMADHLRDIHDRDEIVDEILFNILDRLRNLDGGSGREQFDPPEGHPV